MTAAITCTATTRLSADECMARLAACPALPRGERLGWALQKPIHGNWWVGRACFVLNAPCVTFSNGAIERWRRRAAPLRKAREQRQRWKAKHDRALARLDAMTEDVWAVTKIVDDAKHHPLYCVEHDSFTCGMICRASLRHDIATRGFKP